MSRTETLVQSLGSAHSQLPYFGRAKRSKSTLPMFCCLHKSNLNTSCFAVANQAVKTEGKHVNSHSSDVSLNFQF